MKAIVPILLLILLSLSAFSFKDDSHYSKTFDTTRFFRVFTPPDYNANDSAMRYPVIYYFHGCGGSFERSGTYSYAENGLTPPAVISKSSNPAYEYPNNADFENFVYERKVIVVCVDGKIEGMPSGCGVYFPSQAENWRGNFYNFSAYIRELVDVIDSRYKTKKGPQYRAISGLSMGGQMAIWLAATNPHLFSSASEFCHSPTYFDVGEPSFMTTIDVKQLWRNLKGLPFRHSTNTGDYLRFYTEQLSSLFHGAGFENYFYLADFCKHHAARVDLQFDFHMKYFQTPKQNETCFSFINLYPNFEIRGYNISSTKTGNGWIYLHDVTRNGLGIYTRKRLPFGNSLNSFNISVTTPAIYTPDESYTLSRYSYKSNTFSTEDIKSDSHGRLTLTSTGGIGEEIGITGKGLQPPVFILTDTINENIYLKDNIETSLSFDVINLSASPQTVDFMVTTGNSGIIHIKKGSKQIKIPARSKTRVESLVICTGKYFTHVKNTGYLKISSSINGIVQDREQIIQVNIINQTQQPELSGIKIMDGKTENLKLFKYEWGKWKQPVSSAIISEGTGNGNGKAEIGETFSIWIKSVSAFDSLDIETWHPTVPINNRNNPDISVIEIKQYLFNTGRAVLSAQIRLNRKPTKNNPIKIPIQSEFLKVQPLENDCHRNTADNFNYFYFEIIINVEGVAEIKKMRK
jgi:enterochelin esterase-like enzyme